MSNEGFFRKRRKMWIIVGGLLIMIMAAGNALLNPRQPVELPPDDDPPMGAIRFSAFPESATLPAGFWWIFEVNVTLQYWEFSSVLVHDVFGNETSPVEFNHTYHYEYPTTEARLRFRYDFAVVGNHSLVISAIVLPALEVFNHTIPIEVL